MDLIGGDEQQGITTLAETGHENMRAGFRDLQGLREQQQGMGGAGVAAGIEQVVAERGAVDAAFRGDDAGIARVTATDDEMIDRLRRYRMFFQQRRNGARHDLEVALFAYPALFEHVIETRVAAAVMIDEVH